MNTQLNKLFDKHTTNVVSGQKIVDEIMAAANVKTTADADKVRDAYKARLGKRDDAAKILAIFNTRRLRWMERNGIKAKANTGSRAGKTKAGKVTKLTKKAAATKARRDAMEADSKAFTASMKRTQQAATALHDMTSLLAVINAITEKASKADCVAMRDRIVNQFATIIASKK